MYAFSRSRDSLHNMIQCKYSHSDLARHINSPTHPCTYPFFYPLLHPIFHPSKHPSINPFIHPSFHLFATHFDVITFNKCELIKHNYCRFKELMVCVTAPVTSHLTGTVSCWPYADQTAYWEFSILMSARQQCVQMARERGEKVDNYRDKD